jgi:hypothetical protein
MLMHLTRTMRLRAGRLVALIYLLCVLAPAASFAFAGGAAPCLTDPAHEPAVSHVHAAGAAQHAHHDGHIAGHSAGHAHHDKTPLAAHTNPDSTNDRPQTADTRCCGMLCVNALPATLTEIMTPPAPMSICGVETSPAIADRAPARHYRPPIA